jgi:hypothetical protein
MPYKDKAKRASYRKGYWKKYYSDPERKKRHILAVRKNDAKRIRLIKEWIDSYKLSIGCKVCSFREHPAALDFHHRTGEKKEFNVSSSCRSGWSLEKVKREVLKCDVLCANHHRIHHNGDVGKSGRSRLPVTQETAGSNPVVTAK